jgi:hypothetical protein
MHACARARAHTHTHSDSKLSFSFRKCIVARLKKYTECKVSWPVDWNESPRSIFIESVFRLWLYTHYNGIQSLPSIFVLCRAELLAEIHSSSTVWHWWSMTLIFYVSPNREWGRVTEMVKGCIFHSRSKVQGVADCGMLLPHCEGVVELYAAETVSRLSSQQLEHHHLQP